jgi:hypothetical protein
MEQAATSEPKGVTMSGVASRSAVRELDHRSTDGLEVTLLWDAATDVASVAVVDTKIGETFEVVVGERDNALDVFNHPYAFATRRRLVPTRSAGAAATATV